MRPLKNHDYFSMLVACRTKTILALINTLFFRGPKCAPSAMAALPVFPQSELKTFIALI